VTPATRYAKAADGVHLAYQVLGDGPVDVVAIIGWVSNIETLWEEPTLARFLRRIASFSRLILFDKRGVGLSDRVPDADLPTLETRMDDARVVMDAVGSERAVLFGISEGGPMAMLFAATHPDRTIALLLFGTSADWTLGASSDADFEAALAEEDREWGTIEYARKELRTWAAPSLADDDRAAEWLASYMRRSASPGAAIALARMNRGMDVSAALPAIHVPTLVMARTGDRDFPVADVRETAAAIPGARLVELPGDDHFFWVGDSERVLAEVQRFVKTVGDEEAELDRVLATVLFTDIVGSTERAARLGDRGWRELVEAHDVRLRSLFQRFRGREVDAAGDGFLVTFDGPIRAVRCALTASEAVRDLGLEIRTGLHTGEVELSGDDVRGIAVHVGARVASLAGPSEVLVTSTVKELVAGSALTFEDRGEHALKGVPGEWRVYRALA
jgi:pimeloyl-ACP methyl ester carboxylesterase